MEDKKNGWRCEGDKDAQRATEKEGGRDGGFCGPREVRDGRMAAREMRVADLKKMDAMFEAETNKAKQEERHKDNEMLHKDL